MDIGIGILAGGKSSRMGQNKAFMEFDKKPFITTIIEELSPLGHVLISVDEKEKYNLCDFDLYDFNLIEDENKNIGPIEGLRQILKHSHTPFTFVCATDMPFIKKDLVLYMQQFISSDYDCYVIKDASGSHPLCAIYSKNILPQIEDTILNKNYKLKDLIKNLRTKYISLEFTHFSENIVKNINTMEEYIYMKKPLIFCVSGVKNSGKTSLICKLIKEFKPKFENIAVIKHDGHDFVMDHVGSDTFSYAEAGATHISIFSNRKYAHICQKKDVEISEMIDKIEDVDIIIIEGLKKGPYPKIEVIRKEISSKSVCEPEMLIAIATDTEIKNIDDNLKILSLNNPKKIAETILHYFFITIPL